MDWIFFLLAAGSGIIFTVGDIFIKYWAEKSNIWLIFVGFLFYAIAGTLLGYGFRRRQIAVAVAVLMCFNLLAIAVVGLVLFKETLGIKEVLGMSFALLAIVLLNV